MPSFYSPERKVQQAWLVVKADVWRQVLHYVAYLFSCINKGHADVHGFVKSESEQSEIISLTLITVREMVI